MEIRVEIRPEYTVRVNNENNFVDYSRIRFDSLAFKLYCKEIWDDQWSDSDRFNYKEKFTFHYGVDVSNSDEFFFVAEVDYNPDNNYLYHDLGKVVVNEDVLEDGFYRIIDTHSIKKYIKIWLRLNKHIFEKHASEETMKQLINVVQSVISTKEKFFICT